MSQIYKSTLSSPLPPAVPTSFADDLSDTTILPGDINPSAGSSVPQANVLRVAGDNGIKTIYTPNAPGVMIIRFVKGSTTTIGAVTSTVVSQAILVNATMTIQIIVAGYSTDNLGIGAYATAVVKNVAGTLSLVGTVDIIKNSDSALNAGNVTVTTSGSNLIVQVTGVAGKTIAWDACLPGIVNTP